MKRTLTFGLLLIRKYLKMKRVSVFVNWKEEDVVFTSSNPGDNKEKPGKLAKKLIANKYKYAGGVKGFNLSLIHKKDWDLECFT